MNIVIRFSGDSGDGMQLIGNLFSESAAYCGYSTYTFPDYPAEVRAPQGTIAGVSGFQIHFGDVQVAHPGDKCDVFVAMNPASLIAHRKYVSNNATIIVDSDTFTETNLSKLGHTFETMQKLVGDCNVVNAPITQMCLDTITDRKTALKCRNMMVLGIVLQMYGIDSTYVESFLRKKFNDEVYNANISVLEAGKNYADNTHLIGEIHSNSQALEPGTYRSINGNQAVAWGFLAASEKSGRPLFCGSYPITPATGILEELAKHKALGVKTVQAEDEIAGICTAIGASYGGSLAVTTTSGPGLALKSEAIGLAVMMQLPLVIVDVQRGGPSTGLPTKSEQADLLQAMYGRNGDCPIVVLAATSPSDCFDKAYLAAKIALERMMPVILLTDGNLANGTEPWKVKTVEELDEIVPPIVTKEDLENNECAFNDKGHFNPYAYNNDMARYWAIPGTESLEHRLGGLEKAPLTGAISYDPIDHKDAGQLRAIRVLGVKNMVDQAKIEGDWYGDLLVIGWGSNVGKISEAVKIVREEGAKVSFMPIELINPMQKGIYYALTRFTRVLVCEGNDEQLTTLIKAKHKHLYNDIRSFVNTRANQFTVEELVKVIKKEISR